jgi:hypothetical protein
LEMCKTLRMRRKQRGRKGLLVDKASEAFSMQQRGSCLTVSRGFLNSKNVLSILFWDLKQMGLQGIV